MPIHFEQLRVVPEGAETFWNQARNLELGLRADCEVSQNSIPGLKYHIISPWTDIDRKMIEAHALLQLGIHKLDEHDRFLAQALVIATIKKMKALYAHLSREMISLQVILEYPTNYSLAAEALAIRLYTLCTSGDIASFGEYCRAEKPNQPTTTRQFVIVYGITPPPTDILLH